MGRTSTSRNPPPGIGAALLPRFLLAAWTIGKAGAATTGNPGAVVGAYPGDAVRAFGSPYCAARVAAGSLTLNDRPVLDGTKLELTEGDTNEGRGAFFATPVHVQRFIAAFAFQRIDAVGDGFTFTIQGKAPKARGFGAGGLAYADKPDSVAIEFDLHNDAGREPDSTEFSIDGAEPTVPANDLAPSEMDLRGSGIFNAPPACNRAILTVVITDTVTHASAAQSYTVNIPASVRGPTFYAGFTGAGGGLPAIQEVLDWSDSPASVPGDSVDPHRSRGGMFAQPASLFRRAVAGGRIQKRLPWILRPLAAPSPAAGHT